MATTSSSDHSLNNLVFSSLLMLFTCCHAQTDTLKPGDTLNYSSSSALLVSSTGKFNLVFNEYSSYCYLVIRWMGQPNDVWNANRDKPVSCTSAALTLDKYKTLRITHDAGEPRVLFSASEGSETTNSNTNVVATLLDSGNFVLREVINSTINGSTTTENQKFLWQSFDYPTTVLLPGMKLGMNRRNGRNRLLTSYLSPENPSSGPFTLEWDPKWCELIIRRRGVVYWSSGAFRDGGFEFLSSYDESKQLRYNFVTVSNENEAYFTYNITSEVLQGYKSGWVLASDGNLIENLGGIIAQIVDCYGFKSDGGGCQTWGKQISCRNVTMKFETKVGYFQPCTPDSTNKSDSNASLSISDCKAACWEDCSCIGFSTLFKNLSGCKFYTGNWQLKGQDLSGYSSTISFLISNSSLVPGKNNSTNTNNWKQTIEITSISMAAALSAMVLCIACCIRRRRRRNMVLLEENRANIEREFRDLEESDRFHVSELQKDGNIGQHDLRVFNYASIMAATANFSKQNKLGEGGFGPVYKGKLMAGREIAVKRLSSCSGQGTMEFQNEVVLISELQHTNLVQLLGFCIHGEERMLIYEYMPNKSLDYFLFDSTRAMDLDWKKRFNIIEGVTQGLLYLHRYSRLRVIHRDLKPSNILLDENMNPKISDFGLARIFTHNELQANTNRVVGTYGYMSPEYAMEGIFSIKSDVYSFGVLMLEIISGRKHNSFYNDDAVSIVGYAWELWREGSWQELIDPKLGDSCVIDQLLRCIHVALLCVEENADDRPTMSNVIAMLTSESTSLALPKKPAFLPRTRRRVIRDKVSEIISVNDMSISDLDVR